MASQSIQPPQENGPKIVAAILCFNEERFIGSVAAKARKYADEVVVIDDGSTDESAEIARATGAKVYSHRHNQGYGAAITSALEQGEALGASILVTLDGDGQHDPCEMPKLITPILNDEADVAIGSRFMGQHSGAPFYRRLGQIVLNTATNMASGQKISDSQSGYRAYSAKALKELDLSERGMSVSSEIQFAVRRCGLKVAEVPISVSYDENAKRNPVGHGVNVLNRILVLFSLHHPILLFGLPGLAFLIVGIVFGWRVLSVYNDDGYVPVGDALALIFFGIAGLLALFLALILQAMKELLRGEASQLVKRMKRTETHTTDEGSDSHT